uniref:Small ribosomal subunit protein uS2c n=1 Tax=Boodleopsis sp. FL1161 TaxID=2364084 RepID=A0A386AZ67_9CHLO|nr:ribosomal protein S2 [Boodleopsis sp. FL1161]
MILASTIQKLVQHLVSTNIHLGHKRSQQHPKMIPYIYKQKDNFQIIDLGQTYWYLRKSAFFLYKSSREDKSILFVGTKKHIAPHIKKIAAECNSFSITKRWLGGLLTNWETIKKNTFTLREENNFFSKKKKSQKIRQKKRIFNYFEGIQTMFKLPDVVIIIGQRKEMNAVRECQKLKISTLTILDTDCNPDLTDFFVPANDDSIKSVLYILDKFSKAIKKGQQFLEKQKLEKQKLEKQKLEKQKFEPRKFEPRKYKVKLELIDSIDALKGPYQDNNR